MIATSTEEAVTPAWLELPPVVRMAPSRASAYGARDIAAEYCGLKETPQYFLPGLWQHGWNPTQRPLHHPDLVVGGKTLAAEHQWVSRPEEEEYLRKAGFPNAKAIGLPIVYVSTPAIRRMPGSLLVMPAHTDEFSTRSWRFDDFADQIDAIRGDFSTIVVCIHPSCWRHGLWVDAFRKRGFPLVQGILYSDSNALRRLRALLGSFEFVTTNAFGSAIAYAAYCGAKVSIYGPFAEYKPEYYFNEPFYRRNPQLLGPALKYCSEAIVREHLTDFFCHPLKAKERTEWARREVGEQSRVSPAKLKALFGWDWRSQLARSLSARIPGQIKHVLSLTGKSGYREELERKKARSSELARLQDLPEGTPTTTTLLDHPLELVDGARFPAVYEDLWERDRLHFHANTETPYVIDAGAGIGASAIYFKGLYPQCHIVALESDSAKYQALRRNCERFGINNLELLPSDDSQPVRRLRGLLDRPVDMLKLDLGGTETELLKDCADLLWQVDNLFVVYYSFQGKPQRLDELLSILKASGFRVYLDACQTVHSPMLFRPVHLGLEMRLNVFAYRVPVDTQAPA